MTPTRQYCDDDVVGGLLERGFRFEGRHISFRSEAEVQQHQTRRVHDDGRQRFLPETKQSTVNTWPAAILSSTPEMPCSIFAARR